MGAPKPVTVGNGPLKIAFFTADSLVTYMKSLNGSVTDEGKSLGVSVTTFDPALDPVKQVTQARTALASKQFNAWAVVALSPEMCNVVKQAIAAGIVVSIVNQQVCVPFTTTGNATWYPGTVNFIGGDQTADMFARYLKEVVSLNPGKQKMILLTGPPNAAQTTFLNNDILAAKALNPQLTIVKAEVPDYDLAGAEKAVAALLPANPDATLLFSAYSDMTQGAVIALKAASKSHIRVYDTGGSSWAFNAVKSGQIQMTSVFRPRTMGADSVQSLFNTWYKGEPGPHYVNVLAGLPSSFVTKQNISRYKAEY